MSQRERRELVLRHRRRAVRGLLVALFMMLASGALLRLPGATPGWSAAFLALSAAGALVAAGDLSRWLRLRAWLRAAPSRREPPGPA